MVLHPTLTTGKIFRKMKKNENCVIYGDSGIGKSFSFLIYNYLSKFIQGIRVI